MWKSMRHTSSSQANQARRMFQSVKADHVVVINAIETMVEMSVPNKGLSNKKRNKRARENENKFRSIIEKTQAFVINHKAAGLSLEDFHIARCGLAVINNKFKSHQASCKKCKEILEPTPVNSMTSRHTGTYKLPESQQEISDTARDIHLVNSMEPVTTRTMVGTLDLTNVATVTEEDTYSDTLTMFREALLKKSDAVVDRYAELVTKSNELIKQAEILENEAQNELLEIDSEIIRRQKELEQLIKERDIKIRR